MICDLSAVEHMKDRGWDSEIEEAGNARKSFRMLSWCLLCVSRQVDGLR